MKGIEIGHVWIAKRGRRLPPVRIANIYRPDRQVLVYAPERRVMSWVELRRDYKPSV